MEPNTEDIHHYLGDVSPWHPVTLGQQWQGAPEAAHLLTRMCRSWKKVRSVCRISWNSPAERPPYTCQR